MLSRLGITGAPGSGVTTLGRALAGRLDAVHIDTDDHLWEETDPPYLKKRPAPERRRRMAAEQARTGRWVVSGTLDSWADGVADEAELVLFLEAPTEIRLERLRRREQARFGDALSPGGALHRTHREFIEWAAHYDDGTQPGRSRPKQERWLAALAIPVLRLDATRPPDELVSEVLRRSA
jgi:adenylate kinase family enzyme